jgi:non-homologous end joining protein Ku
VIDLMEALRASVEQASKKTKAPAAKAARSRKAAATASRKR